MEREASWKPNVEMTPNCPRCGSSNTKFCYYNNYSLTQPRYFCKGCRRYWTKGGSLRNIPVGGGCRKNRRGRSVRLSNHDHHGISVNPSSRSLAYAGGGLPHSNSNNSLGESSSTSSTSSPHIDLALVYANFLNQPPDFKTSNAVEMPVSLPNDFDPCHQPLGFSGNLEENNDINVGSLLGSVNHEGILYNDVFDSVPVHQKHDHQDGNGVLLHHHHQDHQLCSTNLPPFPSEEMGGQDHGQMPWLNSNHQITGSNHTVEPATLDPMMLPPEPHDPSSLLFGNWSPFDFPSGGTFSKT